MTNEMMNEPSLHDHRREAEEADDLAKEHDDIEDRLRFDSWLRRLDRIHEEYAIDSINHVMSSALDEIYVMNNEDALFVTLFRFYATHGEDPSANRRLIDFLDHYMRSAVREMGD